MASVSVYNMEGAQVGTIELSDSIFAVPVNEHLVHQAVVAHGDRKEQVMQDRDLSVLHSGQAAELYLLQHQEIIP